MKLPGPNKIVPVAAFVLFSGISGVLWQNQIDSQRALAFRYMETSAEQIRIRVQGLMNARIASLKLLAQRWVERTPIDFSRQRFLQFAELVYTNYPGFASINWIDRAGVLRWVYPPTGKKGEEDRSVWSHKDPAYTDAFRIAQSGRDEYTVTPSVEIYRGGLGFDTFLPLIYNGTLQGYLNGVFQVRLIVDTCLTEKIFENYWISLYEDGRPIYTNGKGISKDIWDESFYVLRDIPFFGKTWHVKLEPKTRVYQGTNTQSILVLVFGLALSLGLSLLLYLLLRRMEMYRKARDQALQQVRQRTRAEQALREKEERLKDLLSELAQKNAELETFVYSVSHDLKTPIVTIDGFVGALNEDFGALIPGEGKKYLQYISEAALKMEVLINDLLELSRIGRLAEKKQCFSFADVAEQALKELGPQIRSRGIEVHLQENLPNIYGEIRLIAQVMENLLSNAVKYIGKKNPSPKIEVGALEQDGQEIFFIRDNGIGFEEIYLEKIFQVFQRLPSAKRAGEGTGIGLAIAKRVIENHGGRIWAKSEPGEGSTFFFTIKSEEV